MTRHSAVRHAFKRYWKVVASLTVSVAALSFLFSRLDGLNLSRSLASADIPILLSAVAVLFVLPLLHLVRWRLILKQLGVCGSAASELRLLFVGYFFNQTLPSAVGGDFLRAWLINREGVHLRIAAASVIADRIAALLGLLVLCLLLSPFTAEYLGVRLAMEIRFVCLLILAVGLGVLSSGPRIVDVLVSFLSFHRLAELARSVSAAFNNKLLTTGLLVLSATVHLITGLVVFLIAKSLGVSIEAMACASLFPFILLATTIPISFAGWGVREAVAIAVFGLVGVSSSDSMLVSVTFGATLLLVGLPGGYFWLARTRHIGFDATHELGRR
jgi:uncharacterized protein (TIRG00374 family)